MSETGLAFVSSEFDIFDPKPVQLAIQDTEVVHYKPIASIDQSDLEFLIPADYDTYIDPDIKLFVRGKLTKADGSAFDAINHTTGVNNFLHSLFSQCTIILNGVTITQSDDLYNYRSILETLLSYGVDATISHLTISYWYKDMGDMLPCDPTKAESTNTGFIDRWNRQKQSRETEMCRINSNICNVPKFLLPGIKLQIKFKKDKSRFYLMSTAADSKTTFKFLDAKLLVKRIKANPKIPMAHETLLQTELALYPLTRVELKTVTFSAGPQSLSIYQAVIERIPKRLLFTMIANTDFFGTINTNPYNFQHFGLRTFVMYVNGRQIPSEGLNIDTRHEITYVMAYNTILKAPAFTIRTQVFRKLTICILRGISWCYLTYRLIWPRRKDILHLWKVVIYALSYRLRKR